MARLRLGYTKSRTGCLRCKQRRVKCDENRPCKACQRHGVDCSLVSGPSRQGESPQTPAQSAAADSPRSRSTSLPPPSAASSHSSPFASSHPSPVPIKTESSHQATSTETLPHFDKFAPTPSHADQENWVADLELLHHFTVYTSKSLFPSLSSTPDERNKIWEIAAPKEAFTHVFLLHQLLAIAAFHLAYLEPHRRKKYAVQASQHQSMAIQGVRAALSNISPHNCHSLFAASALLFISALADSGPVDQSFGGPNLNSLLDVFLLVKGVGGVMEEADAELKSGPFAAAFVPAPQGKVGPRLGQAIHHLEHDFHQRVSALSHEDPVLMDVLAETRNGIDVMRRAVSSSATPEYRILAAWPITMSERYISLLRQRNPVALALLTHYCMIMHATESGYWYTRGWGRGVMQDISKFMSPPWDRDSVWALEWIAGHSSRDLTIQNITNPS
ncbi:hypothetical protein QBC39DRAFT_391922 [Podospora conica]|nr:hypothetical protein QBC39DRAFT_391922 [Schizothecium conicum]